MKMISKISSCFLFALSGALYGQTVSDFESFSVSNSFLNGSSNPGGYSFMDGNVAFENYYDTSFGGYWSGGFAISGVKDSTTAGFTNLYACFPAEGQGGSSNYAMANNFAKAILQGNAKGKLVDGLYIANSTFAVLSMRNGDNFAKKFGGADGNDPDWFKLQVFGQKNGIPSDTVEFYLADFRFPDNSQDYIVEDWQWLDLKPLGDVDDFIFYLSSSDNSQSGMNTPAFFAIDNLKTLDSGLDLIENQNQKISVYPNPTKDVLYFIGLEDETEISISNYNGKVIWEGKTDESGIDVSFFAKGLYFFKIKSSVSSNEGRFIVH